MSRDLEPLPATCDAPPYGVVEASTAVGIESPADVPWYRLCHLPHLPGPAHLRLRHSGVACRCGQSLTEPCVARFTFVSGTEQDYLFAQCKRCRAVYWEQVSAETPHNLRAE